MNKIRNGIIFFVFLLSNIKCFQFENKVNQTEYLILQNAYYDCKSYNVIEKKNKNFNINSGELYCTEDPFCQYFLFNKTKQEIRLCYDKHFVLKKPIYDNSWITSIKNEVFTNYGPNLINTQGICNHKVEKFYFNNLKEAIEHRKENMANFMILNFQAKENESEIETYYCETIYFLADRKGYVIFDFTKLDKPHESCLRARKCGLRGSIQSDDSKYNEGINPGDVIEATKF